MQQRETHSLGSSELGGHGGQVGCVPTATLNCSVAPTSRGPSLSFSSEGEMPEMRERNSGSCAQVGMCGQAPEFQAVPEPTPRCLRQALWQRHWVEAFPNGLRGSLGLTPVTTLNGILSVPSNGKLPHKVTRQTSDQTRIPIPFSLTLKPRHLDNIKALRETVPSCWASPAHGQMLMPPGTAVSLSCPEGSSLTCSLFCSKGMKCFQQGEYFRYISCSTGLQTQEVLLGV